MLRILERCFVTTTLLLAGGCGEREAEDVSKTSSSPTSATSRGDSGALPHMIEAGARKSDAATPIDPSVPELGADVLDAGNAPVPPTPATAPRSSEPSSTQDAASVNTETIPVETTSEPAQNEPDQNEPAPSMPLPPEAGVPQQTPPGCEISDQAIGSTSICEFDTVCGEASTHGHCQYDILTNWSCSCEAGERSWEVHVENATQLADVCEASVDFCQLSELATSSCDPPVATLGTSSCLVSQQCFFDREYASGAVVSSEPSATASCNVVPNDEGLPSGRLRCDCVTLTQQGAFYIDGDSATLDTCAQAFDFCAEQDRFEPRETLHCQLGTERFEQDSCELHGSCQVGGELAGVELEWEHELSVTCSLVEATTWSCTSRTPNGSRVWDVYAGEPQTACRGLLDSEFFALGDLGSAVDGGVPASDAGAGP